MEIATESGFLYGSQLPNSKPYGPIHFADQDWRKPDRAAYIAALALHRPHMATVLDFERLEQLPEVLSWAEDAAPFTERIVVIPKVINETWRIPDCIGGKPVVLGFSVPSQFGATSVPIWEFDGRDIHLLGGSPHRQMREWQYLHCAGCVVSADGNMAQKMALRCCFWRPTQGGKDGYWPKLNRNETDDNYEAFRLSCLHIRDAWKRLTEIEEVNA